MKKVLTNKYFIGAVTFIVVLLIGLLFINNNKKMTNLEKVKIEETSAEIIDYLDEVIDNSKEDGRYICFAIEYLYATNNKNVYSVDEVIDVINKYFNVDYNIDNIDKIGITPYMADKGIFLDRSNTSYTYNKTNIKADIAKTSIIKYELDSIKKINNKEFEVSYKKYIVEDPYKLLNYYNDKNLKNDDLNLNDKTSEIKQISDYLKGKGNIKNVKKLITEKNISKVGKKEKNVTIKYIVKNKKLLIEKVK